MKPCFAPLALLLACLVTGSAFAQSQKILRQKDIVMLSPNADRDIAMVKQYVQDLVAGNLEQARNQLAPGYTNYGPGAPDSANTEAYMRIWERRYKEQQNRTVTFRAALSTQVKEGPLKGDWVMLWLDYAALFKEGRSGTVPVQLTLKLENGKIAEERVYFDYGSIRQQLGWTTKRPTPSTNQTATK